MIITPIDEQFVPKGSGLPRSEGLHISDVLWDILCILERNPAGCTWDMDLTREPGFIWEEALSRSFAARNAPVFRPKELRVDGIYMSPDGIGPDPAEVLPLVLEEYKCTWKGMLKHKIEHNWYWLQQSKCYCYGLGLTVVVFRILYLMGDYRGSGPQYRVIRIEWTQTEIEETWAMVLDHAKERGWL